jgi:hypothetical protein
LKKQYYILHNYPSNISLSRNIHVNKPLTYLYFLIFFIPLFFNSLFLPTLLPISNLNKIPDDFGKKCLIITGPNIEKSPAIKTCKEILDLKGYEYEIFSKVDSEPTSSHVNDIVNFFSNTNSEFLIAVGGGSALDAAKAASVIIKQGAVW